MKMVRDELGSNAVILSNNSGNGQVEILAAMDYDEEAYRRLKTDGGELPVAADSCRNGSDAPEDGVARSDSQPQFESTRQSVGEPGGEWQGTEHSGLVGVQSQIRSLHELVETQLAGLAWGDFARNNPNRAHLLSRLKDFGLSNLLAFEAANQVASGDSLEVNFRECMEGLEKRIDVEGNRVLEEGGCIALVGPSGVGKTTTAAKLAARYVLLNGPEKVALVTTDSYRIGAYDQIRRYACILRCESRLVHDKDDEFSGKELIVVDTAGMSQRDLRLSHQFGLIRETKCIRTYLVLAANAQLQALRQAVRAFSNVDLCGSIVTKLDEAVRVGGIYSAVAESKLPLAYTSSGQRVPEDLEVASSKALLRYGRELQAAYADERRDEEMALAFGERVANALC
jgi:flagellar biosynthesis protein FlhF